MRRNSIWHDVSKIPQSTEDFLNAFVGLGYHYIDGAPLVSRRDGWLLYDRSTEEVTHVATLEFKPTAKSYAVRLGIFNPYAQRLVKRALPSILRYLHPALSRNSESYFGRPHWMLFDAGRALKWPLLMCPDPFVREQWPDQLSALVARLLEPIFWNIRSAGDIIELLYRDDIPFEWGVSGPVLRVAEIVALSKVLELDPGSVKEKLVSHKKAISLGMHGSTDYDGMIDEFFDRIG
jgi:hypothetical protein